LIPNSVARRSRHGDKIRLRCRVTQTGTALRQYPRELTEPRQWPLIARQRQWRVMRIDPAGPGPVPKIVVTAGTRASALALLGLLSACVTSPPPRPLPPAVKAADKPHILTRLGDDVRRSGDAAGAVVLYRSASAASPRDPVPLTDMGEALNESGDPQRAEQAFRTSLTLRSGNPTAQQGLAVALLAQGRPAEALPILQALDKPGAGARLLGGEGTALDMLGRHADAQAVYRRGLQADPTDAALHGNLALSLALAGQAEASLAELRAAVGAPLPDPRQEANAVLVLALLDRLDEARARGGQTIGPSGTETLIDRAIVARQTSDPLRQAQALGVLTAPGMPAVPRSLLPPPLVIAPMISAPGQVAPPQAADLPSPRQPRLPQTPSPPS
jgi:Flp pilus assembly protein TadD